MLETRPDHSDLSRARARTIEDFRATESGPVAILGNGPSLEEVELESVGVPLFGCNRSWLHAWSRWTCYVNPQHHAELYSGMSEYGPRRNRPEVAFAMDYTPERARRLYSGLPRWHGELVLVDSLTSIADNGTMEAKYRPRGDSLDRGRNSHFAGYMAMELAVWMGFTTIYLLGFDGGSGHFYDRAEHANTEIWQEAFRRARPWLDDRGIRVVNCNPESKIDAFEFGGTG